MLVVGGACSEVFGGPHLAKVLQAGAAYEAEVLASVAKCEPASPLVQHTSSSVPPQLASFVTALERHLPAYIRDADDWAVSLQVEGASAVSAGVEMLLQLQAARGNAERTQIAVADRSLAGATSRGVRAGVAGWRRRGQRPGPTRATGKGASRLREASSTAYRV